MQADQNKIIKEKSASIEKKLKENLINKTEKMLTERNNKKIAAKSDEIIRSRRDYKDIKRKSQEQKIEKLLGPNSVKDYGRKTGWAPNSRRRRDADVKKQLKNALNNKSMINSIVKTRGIKKQTNAQIKSTANKQRYNKGLLTQSEIKLKATKDVEKKMKSDNPEFKNLTQEQKNKAILSETANLTQKMDKRKANALSKANNKLKKQMEGKTMEEKFKIMQKHEPYCFSPLCEIQDGRQLCWKFVVFE